MSHKDYAQQDQQRITHDGPERFSDKCVNCDHSRAAHLPKGVRTPVTGGNCRMKIVPKEYEGNARGAALEKVKVVCNCKWRRV